MKKMNLGWNVETYFILSVTILFAVGTVLIIRVNWRQYGLLYLISGAIGNLLCIFFERVGLYSFPQRIFPHLATIPFYVVLTMFPFYVLAGVRYSPRVWAYKLVFYSVIVHVGVFIEVWAENFTQIIRYERFWDAWDSYTWWWLFLLVFEWLGGTIVSEQYRKPLDDKVFRYGKIGWFIVHFILISTVFIAGFYMGRVTMKM
jgi:hypothetical protein